MSDNKNKEWSDKELSAELLTIKKNVILMSVLAEPSEAQQE